LSVENNKRIVKNTIMLYIRMFLTMTVSLYTSRVVLSALGVEDFGIFNVVGGIVAMFSFLNNTLASGTQRFLTFQLGKKDYFELRKTFSTALVIHIFIAVVILFFAETAGLWFLNEKINIPENRMHAARWVYQFSVFSSVISIIQVPYNASLIAHERMNIYAYVSILEVALKLLIVYLLLLFSADKLILYSFMLFLLNVIIISIYRLYCKRKYEECSFQFVHDRALYRSMLTFSGWNVFGSMGAVCTNQGINILLNIFFGPVVNAARGISYQVSNAVMGFVTNFQTAVNPQIVKLYADNKQDDLFDLIFKNSKYAFLLLFLISTPVFFELDLVLQWWLKTVPVNTSLFCRLILIQCLIYSIVRPFVMTIHAIGKMKAVNLTAGTALLMVLPVSYFLLKNNFPSYSPFVVYIFGTLVEFSIELFFLKTYINLSIRRLFFETVLPVLKVVVASLVLPTIFFLCLKQGVGRFLIVSSAACISIVVFTYIFAFEATEKKNVLIAITRKLTKKRL